MSAEFGVPLKVVQELIGLVTIEMTEHYAHLGPDMHREAVGILNPFCSGVRHTCNTDGGSR
jgi:site-specific recombinase XerD